MSEEFSTFFSQTEAYSNLVMKLATDADYAAKFFNAVIPKIDQAGSNPSSNNK